MYLGDFVAGATVRFAWNTAANDGASVTRTTNGTIKVYKDLVTTTEVTTGVTDTEDADGLTGVHFCAIVLSDAFYAVGHDFTVVLVASATAGGAIVNAVLAEFSIQNRYSQPAAAVTVGTNNDKTGYGLSSAAVQAVWDALTSALTTSGSIGKRIVDFLTGDAYARIGAAGAGLTALGDTRIANLDATVSSRLPTAGYTTPPTAVQNRQEMDSGSTKLANLDATVSSRSTLSAAQVNAEADAALADVGLTGTVTGRIDAAVSTRSSHSAADIWAAVTRSLTDKAGFSLSSAGIQAIWDALTSALTSVGSIGKLLVDNINATISSRLATAGYTAPDNAGITTLTGRLTAQRATNLDNLDAAVSSRLPTSSYSAPTVPPTANENADALLDRADAIETGLTFRKGFRLVAAILGGKLSGAGTTTETFRNAVADSKDRVAATVDASGNRSAIALDLT